MIVSKIDPLEAVLYPKKGGINAIISRIVLFCCGKQTLFKKKITVQSLITSKRVKI